MTARQPGQPGYLGPAAEAQRAREIMAARLASPKRGRIDQDDASGLALFGGLAPTLF